MKKTALVLAMMMIAIFTLGAVSAASAENTQYYIAAENGKTVNLRIRPSDSVIARLGIGKPVTVLGDAGNGWTKVSVKLDGATVKGYVMNEFLSAEDPTLAPQSFEKVTRFKVLVTPSNGESGHVNLRAKDSVESVCLRYMHKGDVVTVLAESNAWYQVRTADGTTGYVVKAFVDKFALNS